MTRDEKIFGMQRACDLWFALDAKTRDDLIEGKCIYSQYEGTPIIDYTRTHPIFFEGA
jgi:hypothetical protein